MQTPEEVAQANIDAYNAHDVNALIATFTPSATFGQLGGRILLDGRGPMQGYYSQLFEARPTVRCEVKQRTVMGPFVVELQEISGDDQPGMQAMLISEVREGQIVKVWYSPLAGGPPAH
jgi:hypothetical protein